MTGEVTLRTDGNAVEATALRSDFLLQDPDSIYAQSASWTPEEAEGFVKLLGQSSTLAQRVEAGEIRSEHRAILEHLGPLIACDSQNPPREIDAGSAMFEYIERALPDEFEVSVTDHGSGHVTLFARRGRPTALFNCHLDTVPVGDGWTVPPLELTVRDARAWGRGSCDIKGAAAALLAVAEATDAPMALLFTSDEEGAGGCCVREFLATGRGGRVQSGCRLRAYGQPSRAFSSRVSLGAGTFQRNGRAFLGISRA